MTNPLNVPLLMILIAIAIGTFATAWSPDLLDILARKMRARARAIRTSRKYWALAYNESMAEDVTRENERREMAEFGIELRDRR